MLHKSGRSTYTGYVPSVAAVGLLVLNLLHNCFTYAALADNPEIGNSFRNAIKNDSPFIELYIATGAALRGLPGLTTLGDQTAAAAATPLAPRIKDFPQGADAVFFGEAQSSAQGRMLWSWRLTPFLALLAVVAWMRRQRPVHMKQRFRA
jgi:hypothetical protein